MATSEPKLIQPARLSALLWLVTPLAGMGTFGVLYLIATLLYPGGSQANKQAIGFSWLHNYWCNLLNVNAMNGQPNPARPVALLAMVVLCASLAILWYQLPRLFAFNQKTIKLIQLTGILSMVSACLIFTPYHDLVINISVLFGLIALLYTLVGLYNHRHRKLFWLGCSCLLLMGINNYIYYSRHCIFFLPLIQKITFAAVLSWLGMLNVRLYKVDKLHYLNKSV